MCAPPKGVVPVTRCKSLLALNASTASSPTAKCVASAASVMRLSKRRFCSSVNSSPSNVST
eukprot:UN28203